VNGRRALPPGTGDPFKGVNCEPASALSDVPHLVAASPLTTNSNKSLAQCRFRGNVLLLTSVPVRVLTMSTQPLHPEKDQHALSQTEGSWRILAREAAEERDPQKLWEIISALTKALEEANGSGPPGCETNALALKQCSDCGLNAGAVHEKCAFCSEIFCPSCLPFHLADHAKPSKGQREKNRRNVG
jgi:hypothetical protein